MLVFNKQVDLTAHLKTISSSETTFGFVPTMGALHQGHLSLLKKAIQENKDARVIKEIAIKNGMITFDDSYSRLLRKKLTTLEECIMNKEIIN